MTADAAPTAAYNAVLRSANGAQTLTEIAGSSGCSVADVAAAAQDLFHHGVVTDAAREPVPALSYFWHATAVARWSSVRRAPQEQPATVMSIQGARDRRLLLGLLIEEYFMVSSAPVHISAGVAHAPSERMQLMLSEYLAEEYSHGLWLRQGLVAAGLSERDLAQMVPLPGTTAVINFLRVTASTDTLAYGICLSFHELAKTEERVAWIRTAYDRLVDLDLFPEAALAPSRDHLLEDVEADHASLCEEFFADVPALSVQQQDALMKTAVSYAHTLHEYMLSVGRFYREPDGPRYLGLEA
ncbi:MAG: hypothetical protein KDK70_28465 [Myxococcales bacterium]|nr:hypothetical protein [Myxococcales bacterium]